MNKHEPTKQQVPERVLGVPYTLEYYESQVRGQDGKWRLGCRRGTVAELKNIAREEDAANRNLRWVIDMGPAPKRRIVKVKAECVVTELL